MSRGTSTQPAGIRTIAELEKYIAAVAVATGNTFAFHELYSRLREFSVGDNDANVPPQLLDALAYLMPGEEEAASDRFRAATELVESCRWEGDAVPATILEETAKEAIACGKFAYAEDAYRLLGIKKEMVALYAQTAEQFLRNGKPKHAAISLFVAASIDDPIGPHYQYLGPELHAECRTRPQQCVTALSADPLLDAAIRFLLPHEQFVDRIESLIKPEHKKQIVGALAASRDLDLPGLVSNLRAAVAELSRVENGTPDDYGSIMPALLGRAIESGEAWQYLKDFCFEHPLGALCVCIKIVRYTPVLVPVIRDGASIVELLLPPELLKA
jgi:hypothetical protein